MQKELDPKIFAVIIAVVVLVVGWFLYTRFQQPANFSGPRVIIHAPPGMVAGGAPGRNRNGQGQTGQGGAPQPSGVGGGRMAPPLPPGVAGGMSGPPR